MTIDEKLADVAKRIGVEYITLDQLIDAYFRIREQYQRLREDELNQFRGAMQRAKEVFELEKPYNYISYEELSNMTLREIAEKIS